MEEVKVDEYETSITGSAENGFVITNTHAPEKTVVSGQKTWNDANNQDGKRPVSITINLMVGDKIVDTKTVTEADGWAWTFENLDKYADGEVIEYRISENPVEDYTTTYDGYNVTNSYTPEKTGVSVKKEWNDANNQDGIRPTSVTVKLLANGKDTGKTLVLSAANGWAGSFTDLDVYANGEKIAYTVEEVEVAKYETAIVGSAENGFVITNSYTPEKTQVSVQKVWNDANNQDGKRPESITVNLYADGKFVAAATLVEVDGWSWTFTNLAKYADGKLVIYTVEEVSVRGYTTAVSGNAAEGFVITNSYTPEKTQVSVQKVWNDANNQDGIRPTSVTVKLLANGKETGKTLVLSAANDWAGIFAELDKFANGEEIVYTVEEIAVAKYNATVSGNAAEGFVITNTYAPEKVTVSGNKTWVDANDKDGIRPKAITITLLANGKIVATKTVTEADGWAWTFADLDKYADGVEIVYTIFEEAVEGYTTTYDGYNVINTHVAGTSTEIGGIKYLDSVVWKGFKFILSDENGNALETVESGADGKFVFSKLTYSAEGIYKYTVKEVTGEDEDILYDETVYTVIVTVTKDGEALAATQEVFIGDVKYEKVIEFNNSVLTELPPPERPPLDDIPDTGDNAGVYMFILALTFVALNVTLKIKRRRFN